MKLHKMICACLLAALLAGCAEDGQLTTNTSTPVLTELTVETTASSTAPETTTSTAPETTAKEIALTLAKDTEPVRTETAAAKPAETREPGEMRRKPPENGWSYAELAAVTELAGHTASIPLSVSALGGDFELKDIDTEWAKIKLMPGSLYYRGKRLTSVTAVQPHDEMLIYCIVLIEDQCEVTETEPISVNGVRLGDSMETAIAALGKPYYQSDNSLMYNDRETNNSIISLFFENGRLNHYLIDLRFDIDLPLYRDHKLFS